MCVCVVVVVVVVVSIVILQGFFRLVSCYPIVMGKFWLSQSVKKHFYQVSTLSQTLFFVLRI